MWKCSSVGSQKGREVIEKKRRKQEESKKKVKEMISWAAVGNRWKGRDDDSKGKVIGELIFVYVPVCLRLWPGNGVQRCQRKKEKNIKRKKIRKEKEEKTP